MLSSVIKAVIIVALKATFFGKENEMSRSKQVLVRKLFGGLPSPSPPCSFLLGSIHVQQQEGPR